MSEPLKGAAAIFEQMWRASEKECDELRADNARLRAALKWALPLAELALEDYRQLRLSCGHHDISTGTNHVGLHDFEIAARDEARRALEAGRLDNR